MIVFIVYIIIGLGFMWLFFRSLEENREFGNHAPVIVAILAIILSFILWKGHDWMKPGLSLLAGSLFLLVGYVFTVRDRWDYNDAVLRVQEVMGRIIQSLQLEYVPYIIFPTPRSIHRTYEIDMAKARKLYSDYANAYVYPDSNGNVFMVIFPALVRNFSDDTLAFVLLHELGHVFLNHIYQGGRMNKEGTKGSILGGLLGTLTGAVIGGLIGGGVGAVIGAGLGMFGGAKEGKKIMVARFSREQEREADMFAAITTMMTGYNLEKVKELMEYFDKQESYDFLDELYSDHPPAYERWHLLKSVMENPQFYKSILVEKLKGR